VQSREKTFFLIFVIQHHLKKKVNDKKQPELDPHLFDVFVGVDDRCGVDGCDVCRRDSSCKSSFEFYLKPKMSVEYLKYKKGSINR